MTATVEPGRAEDWEDTGPIPLYTRPSGDTAMWRDRGRIIADLIAERDEARAEVRDLRAKVAAVEALADEWGNGSGMLSPALQLRALLAAKAHAPVVGKCRCGVEWEAPGHLFTPGSHDRIDAGDIQGTESVGRTEPEAADPSRVAIAVALVKSGLTEQEAVAETLRLVGRTEPAPEAGGA